MRTTLLLAFTYQGGSWGSHQVSAILIAYYGTSTYTPTATHSWYRTKIGWRLPVSGCSTVGREPPAGLRILELEAEYRSVADSRPSPVIAESFATDGFRPESLVNRYLRFPQLSRPTETHAFSGCNPNFDDVH
jgi:hypothetical protein